MTRFNRSTLFAAAMLVVTSAQVHAQAMSKGLHVGDMAPTVVINTLDGKPADLAQYVGKTPVLIEFWATWCPLCRSMEPTIARIQQENGKKLAIVRIVVPQNQTPEKASDYVTKNALPGVFLFDTDGAAYKAFAAYHTSYIVVLDKSGKVMYSSDGGAQDLTSAIAAALR